MDSSSLILWHVTNEALWDGDESDSERLQWNELYTVHQWLADSNKSVSAIDTAATCLLKRFGNSLITETLLLDLYWENHSPLTFLVIPWMCSCLRFSMAGPWKFCDQSLQKCMCMSNLNCVSGLHLPAKCNWELTGRFLVFFSNRTDVAFRFCNNKDVSMTEGACAQILKHLESFRRLIATSQYHLTFKKSRFYSNWKSVW